MAQNSDSQSLRSDDILKLAAEIVAAYVSNNPVPASELPAMIKSIHSTLGGLGGTSQSEMQTGQKPAVPVKRSVNPDYIICLEDGKKLKMLKRYLRSNYNMVQLVGEEDAAGQQTRQRRKRRLVRDETRGEQEC